MKQHIVSQVKTLASVKIGTQGIIRQFTNDQMACKMMSMGILPGKTLRLVRRVPFGGGLYIKVESNNIAVRNIEAQNILIEILPIAAETFISELL